jgi:hypothetical protein
VIGIIIRPEEEAIAREFFELFKTPWEVFQKERRYDVVLCTTDHVPSEIAADLLLIYSGHDIGFDTDHNLAPQSAPSGSAITGRTKQIPIYGDLTVFAASNDDRLVVEALALPIFWRGRIGSGDCVRIGYDLFEEVRLVLLEGQPSDNAMYPTVDLHIDVLRDVILEHGIALVEIPPLPHGCPFIACLTHDVDHASIRRHKLDATVLGFIYRATFRSVVEAARGRIGAHQLLTNWLAVAKLPLVHIGVARDFWSEFDRYLDLEDGRPSTFFVVPFEGRAGRRPAGFKAGRAPKVRATAYDISHIAEKVRFLAESGCEIGLHGLDAWCDEASGREELNRIAQVSGQQNIGVRMHWLYLDEESPRLLESAGFLYDSTSGYNDKVGYRAGTSQAFKPLIGRLIENAVHHGGVLTLNWHDRSIAPERLWGGLYSRVVTELADKGAWFATAGDVARWFNKKRSAVFENGTGGRRDLRVRIPQSAGPPLPQLRLRQHQPLTSRTKVAGGGLFEEVALDSGDELQLRGEAAS